MTPVTVGAVFVTFTVCAVAAVILLRIQAREKEAEKTGLRCLLNHAAARADHAEALVRELRGGRPGPECTVLTAGEEAAFGDIADQLEVDMGLEIFGDEGGER